MQEKFELAEKIDGVISQMLKAKAKVTSSKGSIVSLPKAELDLLGQVEVARDLVMSVLGNCDRTLLQDVFGGDCTRIAQVRALCESIGLSEMNQGDQRLPTCLRACESMEKILVDLGMDEALQAAQVRATQSCALARLVTSAATPARSPRSVECPETTAPSAERILNIVQADAERREAHLHATLAELRAELFEQLDSCKNHFEQQLTKSESQVSDKFDVLVGRLKQSDELLRLALQQQKSSLQDGQRKLEQRAAAAAAELEELRSRCDACAGHVEGLVTKLDVNASKFEEELRQSHEELAQRCVQIGESQSETLWCLSASREGLECMKSRFECSIAGLDSHCSKLEEEMWKMAREMELKRVELGTQIKEDFQCHVARELEKLQDTMTEKLAAHGQEMEEASAKKADALWQSFAHVGSLIKGLEQHVVGGSQDSCQQKSTS
eukprot:TRINITY_DN34851_c0_g1_i1.p1 TRINITY_DN34851_c0_g1~~TRINITY_DN34851_c0_g1_i1.p1  ORF type:complete len:468 (-),score=133.21 TRINITY_DN34851_c0_g1_i1:53-1372(-)